MEDLYKTVEEIPDPIEAEVTGNIPDWVDGALYRNGPGKFEFGETKFNHWFDGMALLHRFKIKHGKVTYHNKFLQSDTYMRNKAANKIVVSEFGTVSYPDPCKNIFQRFFSRFSLDASDNNIVNIYPVGDSLYTATETNYLIKVDPETLDRTDKVDIKNYVAVNMATAHPHIEPDGTVYNMGSSFKGSPKYNIIKFTPPPKGDAKFVEKAEIVASISAENKWKPSYYHSFAITENYFIMLELPLVFNLGAIITAAIRHIPANKALKWIPGKMTRIHMVDRKTGEKLNSDLEYLCDPFLCFHHMNAYEQDGNVVVDFCALEDDTGLRILELDKLQSKEALNVITNFPQAKVLRLRCPVSPSGEGDGNYSMKEKTVTCKIHEVTEHRMDFPQINYMKYNGRPYKYCYGAGVKEFWLDSLKKVNVDTGEALTWYEKDCYPSEPVFVPHPEAQAEDHGVILSVVLTTGPGRHAFLLVLDARDFQEMARARIDAKLSRDTHGYFHKST